jgi:hypothetical protein
MNRSDLERPSKEELIELVLRLRRPEKTSRTSSKPPSTDQKERRENARPGGAKSGDDGHSRKLCEAPDVFEDHAPTHCQGVDVRAKRRSRSGSRRLRLCVSVAAGTVDRESAMPAREGASRGKFDLAVFADQFRLGVRAEGEAAGCDACPCCAL